MKILTTLAAASTLAIAATPAQAAELNIDASGVAPAGIELVTGFGAIDQTADHAKDPPRHARAYGRRYRDRDRYYYDDDDDDYDRRRYDRRYDRYGRYREPRKIRRGDRIWRGRDGRYYCKRDNGTTGLIIGAGVGALLGREVDRRGDRTLGTVLGAVAGGLLGREIDRGDLKCR